MIPFDGWLAQVAGELLERYNISGSPARLIASALYEEGLTPERGAETFYHLFIWEANLYIAQRWPRLVRKPMKFAVYKRTIDDGRGEQILLFENERCVSQRVVNKNDAVYEGDGNPEFIGQSSRALGLSAMGFKRVRSDAQVDAEFDRHWYKMRKDAS
jgi:hypothetical protein